MARVGKCEETSAPISPPFYHGPVVERPKDEPSDEHGGT